MIEEEYPALVVRIKALCADALVILTYMTALAYLFSFFEGVPVNFRTVTFIFVFVIYKPLFVSFLGGTIGHQLLGLCVKQEDDSEKNIPFYRALIRFVVKVLGPVIALFLGSFSILTVDARKRGLHDMAAGSVVIYKQKNR